MGKHYTHFDHKERTLIYWWQKEHLSLREMGRRLRRSHTSISRELRRNRWCQQPYFHAELSFSLAFDFNDARSASA